MSTITEWFGNNNNYIDTLYFHFDWLYKTTFWEKKKLKNYNYLTTVNWKYNKKNIKVVLCCCNDLKKILHSDINFSINNYYKYNKSHIPILKSNLQKCIRRQLTILSIKTAISLCLIIDENKNQIGLSELLRRICIIIVEDVYIMDRFNTLFWLYILTTKNYFLNDMVIKYIINSVAYISEFLYFDNKYLNYKLKNKKFKLNDIYLSTKILKKHKNYLYSLMFRKSYGGLKGDIVMIDKLIEIWYYRFINNSYKSKLLFNLPYMDNIEYISIHPTELLLESLDFHCTNICFRIKKIYKINNDMLKYIIWYNNSSINTRIKCVKINNINTYENKWKIIKPIFLLKSSQIRKEIFNL
jgi:hypothetical protein